MIHYLTGREKADEWLDDNGLFSELRYGESRAELCKCSHKSTARHGLSSACGSKFIVVST